MNAHVLVVAQREQGAMSKIKRLVDQLLRGGARLRRLFLENANDDLDIVLAEPIQAERFSG